MRASFFKQASPFRHLDLYHDHNMSNVVNSSEFGSFIVAYSYCKKGKEIKIENKPFYQYLVMGCLHTWSADPPTVSETKLNFLKAYKRPIPSIYNSVLQELIVQQHLMRYKRSYTYDPVFALGFVTVYDQLMEGYPSDEDRDAIFKAYIKALNEDPDQYRLEWVFVCV